MNRSRVGENWRYAGAAWRRDAVSGTGDFRSGNTRVAFDGVVNDPMRWAVSIYGLNFLAIRWVISMTDGRSAARYPAV